MHKCLKTDKLTIV